LSFYFIEYTDRISLRKGEGKVEDKKEESKCFICGATSDERVLLNSEHEGESKKVCVRCLPPLIHGGG